jgi:hypothetical protein
VDVLPPHQGPNASLDPREPSQKLEKPASAGTVRTGFSIKCHIIFEPCFTARIAERVSMFIKRTKKLVVFLLIASLYFLTGCSKLTRENYDKLKPGMTSEEIVKILGKADSCRKGLGAKSCTWGSDVKNIKIRFLSDKMVFHSSKGL